MLFPQPKKTGRAWGVIMNAATMGLHIVSGTFVGFVCGWYLDNWLGTKPWLTLIMLVLGVIAGFKNVYEDVRKIQRYDREEQTQDESRRHDG